MIRNFKLTIFSDLFFGSWPRHTYEYSGPHRKIYHDADIKMGIERENGRATLVPAGC
jgi:hypothetical protein